MAKKKAKGGDGEAEGGGGKSKLKLILIILIGFLLFVIIGVGSYLGAAYFLQLPPFEQKGPSPEEIAARAAAEEAEMLAKSKDVYIKFDKPFTFNVVGTRAKHTGHIEAVLVVSGPDNEAIAKQHLALLSSTFFQALAAQSYDELLKPSGRERLKSVLTDLARAKMSEVAKAPVVEKVLFTSYIVQ